MGGGGGGSKIDPPSFWVENHESFGFFFDFEPKQCFRVPTPWGLYGVEWDERWVVYALFTHFCSVGGFGDFGDPVPSTLKGVSGDVVTVYAY